MTGSSNRRPKWPPGTEIRRGRLANGKQGEVGRVRYTDRSGKHRSATFERPRDAWDFKAQLRVDRRGGRLDDLDRGRETLSEYLRTWWADRAGEWTGNTQKTYRRVLVNHIEPRLGDTPMRDLRVRQIDAMRSAMQAAGVGPSVIRKTMVVLQSALSDAVRWEILETNPAVFVKKPPVRQRITAVYIPTALEVEQVRVQLDAYSRAMISALAYLGLRPGELLGLRWTNVRTNTVLIEERVAGDELLDGQKAKGKPPRSIDLGEIVKADLAAHRRAVGAGHTPRAFVFARPDGGHWIESDWRNWRRRRFKPAAKAAGLKPTARPYDLRHRFASLRIAERRLSLLEVAEQMGHTLEEMSRTYSHVIAEFRGAGAVDIDETVRTARAGATSWHALRVADHQAEAGKALHFRTRRSHDTEGR